MTGYNRMNQRLTIKKTGLDIPKLPAYVPCPKCGTLMRTEKRAEGHCREVS